jgi:hypothetical protein
MEHVALADDLWLVSAGAVDASEPPPVLSALATGGGAARRVALVRAVFLPDGLPPPPLRALLRALGHRVVALSTAAVREPREARLVDEWTLPADGASAPQLTAAGVPLALYLTQRCVQSVGAAAVCVR